MPARAARARGGGTQGLLGLWTGWLRPPPGSPTASCVAYARPLTSLLLCPACVRQGHECAVLWGCWGQAAVTFAKYWGQLPAPMGAK